MCACISLFDIIGIQVVMAEVNEMMIFSMFDCGGVCKVIKYYYMTMLGILVEVPENVWR